MKTKKELNKTPVGAILIARHFEGKAREKGITLVALIITIIVLIILAAVTIITFTETGLLNTAVEGTQNYANAQSYEQKIMDNLDDLTDKVIANITGGSSAKPTEPVEPTAVYVKLYTDGTLMFSSTDYTDTTKEVSESYGDISKKKFGPDADKEMPSWMGKNINNVIIHDKIAPTSTACWFYGCYNVSSIDLEKLDTSNVTDMSYMFTDCTKLSSLVVVMPVLKMWCSTHLSYFVEGFSLTFNRDNYITNIYLKFVHFKFYKIKSLGISPIQIKKIIIFIFKLGIKY